ncbi:HET domain containing protein [Hyaloscypha variabilis]
MADNYIYRSLTKPDAIRLILLDPSPDLSSPLSCRLLLTTLSRCKRDLVDKYTALSYVWGESQRTSTITVDGKIFHITASLDSALRHLRDPGRKRQIWADAICIDQDNIAERNQQVRQMGSVYATADHTVIYLGEGTPETDRLLNDLQITHDLHALCNQPETLSAVKLLLSLPWFRRIWVLQELVLSRDPWIQCGTYLIQWNQLENCVRQLDATLHLHKQIFLNMSNLRSEHLVTLVMPPKKTDLDGVAQEIYDLLVARRGLGAADPCDILFANVHLVFNERKLDIGSILATKETDKRFTAWKDFPLIDVDYAKNSTQVYGDISRFFIQRFRDCRTLSLRGPSCGKSEQLADLPTWVTDWTSSPSSDLLAFGESPNPQLCILKDSSEYPIAFSDDSRIMAFRGMLLGRVKADPKMITPDTFDTSKFTNECLRIHGPWKFLRLIYQDTYEQLKESLGPNLNPKQILDLLEAADEWVVFQHHESTKSFLNRIAKALSWTLSWEQRENQLGNDFNLATGIYVILEWINGSLRLVPPGQEMEIENIFSMDIDLSQVQSIFAHLVVFRLGKTKSILSSRRLAVLDTDILTIAPLETLAGDVVAMLPQHRFPVLLRSKKYIPATGEEIAVELELSKQLWDAQKPHRHGFGLAMDYLVYSTNTSIQHCLFVGECFVQGAMFNGTLENYIHRHLEDIEEGWLDDNEKEQPPFQPMSFALY